MTFPPYLAAIPCKLSASVFFGECVFEVVLANGERYDSTAPRHFCWDASGALLSNTASLPDPNAGGLPGAIAVKLRDLPNEGQAVVEVPDGVLIAVRATDILARPTKIVPPGVVPA